MVHLFRVAKQPEGGPKRKTSTTGSCIQERDRGGEAIKLKLKQVILVGLGLTNNNAEY